MASTLPLRKSKHLSAQVATDTAPCGFCERAVDDELLFGKSYVIGDIYCHYFCVLLSCCLIQKANEEEGLFGFLYTDILAEIKRSKKHKCSYCMKAGATLGCSISKCRKQFHLPCGREKNAVSMFHGNYKSFCQQHVPKQKIPNNIIKNIEERKQRMKKLKDNHETDDTLEMVCVICYESVDAFPTVNTFWPPCCARDAWFHRTCLQRMALSAGVHYLKCPLCNDIKKFYDAVLSQGYYVPDRDASWELEQNAFAEIYERSIKCNVDVCKCPDGREHDSESGPWDIKLCLLCGSLAAHTQCADVNGNIYVCPVCLPVAPNDPKYLETINAMNIPDPNSMPRAQRGPRMPSRMSIRRTKPRLHHVASTSYPQKTTNSNQEEPKRLENESVGRKIGNEMSPMKMLKQQIAELDSELLNSFEWDSNSVIESVKEKLKKPKPLSVRKKIISSIIHDILNEITEKKKLNEPIKELSSPKKGCNVSDDVEMEAIEENVSAKNSTDTCKVDEYCDKFNDIIIIDASMDNIFRKEEENCGSFKDCNENFEENQGKNFDLSEIGKNNRVYKDSNENIEINQKEKSQSFKDSCNIENQNIKENNDVFEKTWLFAEGNDEISKKKYCNTNILTEDFLDENLPIVDPKSISKLKDDCLMDVSASKFDTNVSHGKENKKISLKFSPMKDVLGENVNIDLEIFKNHYLNEVSCKKNNKIDILPIEKSSKSKEKKSTDKKYRDKVKDKMDIKQRDVDRRYKKDRRESIDKQRHRTIDKYRRLDKDYKYHESSSGNNFVLKFVTDDNKNKKNKNTKLSIRNKKIKVDIKWKKTTLKLKISESNSKKQKLLTDYFAFYNDK